MKSPIQQRAAELSQRISHSYLAIGGLFNPEMANHDVVRDWLMEIRDLLDEVAKPTLTDHLATALGVSTASPSPREAIERALITRENYLDELEAIAAENNWQFGLDHGRSPFTSEVSVHIGEGGATTLWKQDGKIVGISTRIRDELNRTVLVLVDFAHLSPAHDARDSVRLDWLEKRSKFFADTDETVSHAKIESVCMPMGTKPAPTSLRSAIDAALAAQTEGKG